MDSSQARIFERCMGTRDLFFLQVSWNPPCFAKAGPCSARRSVPSAPPGLSQSVLRDFAKIRIGVSDSKFVLPAPFEEAVAAQAAIEECRDRAGLLVGQGYLAKKSPAVILGSLDKVLSKRVIG